ncbi:MAG TPA: hypothetical protein VF773_11960 [Verrucomicrobiae bacterium]
MDAHYATLHHLAAALRELAAAERAAQDLPNDHRAYVSMRAQEAHRETKLAVTYLALPEVAQDKPALSPEFSSQLV